MRPENVFVIRRCCPLDCRNDGRPPSFNKLTELQLRRSPTQNMHAVRERLLRRRLCRQLRNCSESDITLVAQKASVRSHHVLAPHAVPHLGSFSSFVQVAPLISPKLKAHSVLPFRLQAVSRMVFTLKLTEKQSGINSKEASNSYDGQFSNVATHPTFRNTK